MNERRDEPPRAAEWLLSALVPRGVRGASIVGDAREEFVERTASGSELAARLWYWRHVLSMAPHFVHNPWTRHLPGEPERRTHNSFMKEPLSDALYALRVMKHRPGFTLVVVFTLAVGIGATTAMFGTINAALLSRLPFDEPDRLVLGRATFDGDVNPSVSGYDYYDYRDQSQSFDSLSAYMFGGRVTVLGDGEPERVTIAFATWDLFTTLRVSPPHGRLFLEEEGVEGGPNVVMISYGYWQRRFGGTPDVNGSSLIIDGSPYTIVGVLPARFHFMNQADLWRLTYRNGPGAQARRWHNLLLAGRLASGVTLEQAQAEIDAISSHLEKQYPETNEGKALLVTGLHDALVENVQTSLLMLMAAVSLVLLLACGNVAGLLLVRAQTRLSEIALRSALGASRWRLVRQLLTESMLMALVAGIVGIGLASAFQSLLVRLLPVGQLGITRPSLDTPVLLFALGISIVTGLIFGVVPALQGTIIDLSQQLKAGTRATWSRGSSFLRSGLVVLQVAISVTLLIASGLMVRSLAVQMNVNLGFVPTNVLTAEVRLPNNDYPDPESRIAFFTALIDEVRALPGVVSAGIIDRLPILNPSGNIYVYRADEPLGNNPESNMSQSADFRRVVPGYFETMGIPLLSGRDIAETDIDGVARVMIVSESMAELFFADANPLGQRLIVDMGEMIEHEVVGVVANARLSRLTSEPFHAMYMSYYQNPQYSMRLAVRSQTDPLELTRPIRELLLAKDRNIPLAEPMTMQTIVDDALADFRIITSSLGLLAAIALLLALVGLYSVLAYFVSQRYHEMGVRMALGATDKNLITLILGHGLTLVGIGLAFGIGGALAATRVLRQLLFEIEPTDPVTFVGVVIFLFLVALVACLLPAWRATRVNPATALHTE